MNFLKNLISTKQKGSRLKRRVDYKQEILMLQGREQFKTLIRKGLGVPVVLL